MGVVTCSLRFSNIPNEYIISKSYRNPNMVGIRVEWTFAVSFPLRCSFSWRKIINQQQRRRRINRSCEIIINPPPRPTYGIAYTYYAHIQTTVFRNGIQKFRSFDLGGWGTVPILVGDLTEARLAVRDPRSYARNRTFKKWLWTKKRRSVKVKGHWKMDSVSDIM